MHFSSKVVLLVKFQPVKVQVCVAIGPLLDNRIVNTSKPFNMINNFNSRNNINLINTTNIAIFSFCSCRLH